MKFKCGKCSNVFEVVGIKESVVTCSKCGSKNSIRESSDGDIRLADVLHKLQSYGPILVAIKKEVRKARSDSSTSAKEIVALGAKVTLMCEDITETFEEQDEIFSEEYDTPVLSSIWSDLQNNLPLGRHLTDQALRARAELEEGDITVASMLAAHYDILDRIKKIGEQIKTLAAK